jgi:hypothetical protein
VSKGKSSFECVQSNKRRQTGKKTSEGERAARERRQDEDKREVVKTKESRRTIGRKMDEPVSVSLETKGRTSRERERVSLKKFEFVVRRSRVSGIERERERETKEGERTIR